ncbi:Hypothetical_protein [Hexamita inflata]|uniref:Hypothetical_protein n=1 Tax=Hexamita inflata TaxID=28002 RepID=A0AA86UD24_9EUKA|nr:Hypothetical protein HINF_LOCUS38519 [Hexamita inflata]
MEPCEEPEIMEISDTPVAEVKDNKIITKIQIENRPKFFSKIKYQQLIDLYTTNAYTMKQAINAEIMLSKLFFESIDQAKQQIKLKTTLRCITSANGFSCVFQQRKNSQLQLFNIGEVGIDDFTENKIQQKIALLKNEVQRRSTIKNSCQKTCGVSVVQGKTLQIKYKRYASQFDFIVNKDLEVIDLQQYDCKKTYYKIQFYNEHDKGDLACKFTNIQTKSRFTQQQIDYIQEFIKNHEYQDFEAFWILQK